VRLFGWDRSKVLIRPIAEARDQRRALTLPIVKINPASRLYETLGFRMTLD
jgi:hypothetical protein